MPHTLTHTHRETHAHAHTQWLSISHSTQPRSQAREGEPTRETTLTAAQQYIIMLALNIPTMQICIYARIANIFWLCVTQVGSCCKWPLRMARSDKYTSKILQDTGADGEMPRLLVTTTNLRITYGDNAFEATFILIKFMNCFHQKFGHLCQLLNDMSLRFYIVSILSTASLALCNGRWLDPSLKHL